MCSVDPFTALVYHNKDSIGGAISRTGRRIRDELKRQGKDIEKAGKVIGSGGLDGVRDTVREQRMAGIEAEKQAGEQVLLEKRERAKVERAGLARLLQNRYRAQRAIRGPSSTGGGSVDFGTSNRAGRTLLGA